MPVNKKIYKYTLVVKPRRCKTKTTLAKKGRYVDRKGQITGELRMIRGWHGIGQVVRQLQIMR
jgi:hypothetical protein